MEHSCSCWAFCFDRSGGVVFLAREDDWAVAFEFFSSCISAASMVPSGSQVRPGGGSMHNHLHAQPFVMFSSRLIHTQTQSPAYPNDSSTILHWHCLLTHPLLTLLQNGYARLLGLETTLLKIPHKLLITRSAPFARRRLCRTEGLVVRPCMQRSGIRTVPRVSLLLANQCNVNWCLWLQVIARH